MISISVAISQKKPLPGTAIKREQAVDERDRDRQRDQQHHPRLTIANFRYRHLQKRQPAIEENSDGKRRTDQAAAGKFRHCEAEPRLNHRAEQQHRDSQDEGNPEALAKHLLVTGVIDVPAAVTLMPHRTVIRVVPLIAHFMLMRRTMFIALMLHRFPF